MTARYISNARALRPLKFRPSAMPHAEGSCVVSMGRTEVLCVATVENEAPFHAKEKGIGWVTAEYAMLPRAGERRTSRSRANSGGRVQEISRLIGRSLRAVVNLAALGDRTIIVDCDVLRADGGTRTASINGGYIALVQALKKLYHQKHIKEWPVTGIVGAVSVGLVRGVPVLDMAYEDDKNAETDFNVVMTKDGRFVELQGTAEGNPYSMEQAQRMIALARSGLKRIHAAQVKAIGRVPAN